MVNNDFIKGLLFCALANAVLVVLTCGLIMQATTQTKILKHTLKNISDYTEREKTYYKISQCILHYAGIIKYALLVTIKKIVLLTGPVTDTLNLWNLPSLLC